MIILYLDTQGEVGALLFFLQWELEDFEPALLFEPFISKVIWKWNPFSQRFQPLYTGQPKYIFKINILKLAALGEAKC